MNDGDSIEQIRVQLRALEKRIAALEKPGADKKTKVSKGKASVIDRLNVLASEGFLDVPRTAREIFIELGRRGHMYKRPESLTGPLLRAVGHGLLERRKTDKHGWGYSKKLAVGGVGGLCKSEGEMNVGE